jgi:hypothetical protein
MVRNVNDPGFGALTGWGSIVLKRKTLDLARLAALKLRAAFAASGQVFAASYHMPGAFARRAASRPRGWFSLSACRAWSGALLKGISVVSD